MSNLITLQATTFTNHPSDEKSYGYRAYDNYGQTYNNVMQESDMELDPVQFLDQVLLNDIDDTFGAMIQSIVEFQGGLQVNGIFLVYEEIENILEEYGHT